MKVVTVATDVDNFMLKNALIASCQYFDLDLVILNPVTSWESHRIKDQCLAFYLAQMDPDEVVFFSDAYDTLIMGDADRIMGGYAGFNAPILFSTEINCWPVAELNRVYAKMLFSVNHRFLNSGGFIGKASSILDTLQKFPVPPLEILRAFDFTSKQLADYQKLHAFSNQFYWTTVYFSIPELIKLDLHAELFLTMGSSLSYFNNNYQEYLLSGVRSNMFHHELNRISGLLHAIDLSALCHIHFNNPVSTHVFIELYKRKLLPLQIKKIFTQSGKHGRKPPEIVNLTYNHHTKSVEHVV